MFQIQTRIDLALLGRFGSVSEMLIRIQEHGKINLISSLSKWLFYLGRYVLFYDIEVLGYRYLLKVHIFFMSKSNFLGRQRLTRIRIPMHPHWYGSLIIDMAP